MEDVVKDGQHRPILARGGINDNVDSAEFRMSAVFDPLGNKRLLLAHGTFRLSPGCAARGTRKWYLSLCYTPRPARVIGRVLIPLSAYPAAVCHGLSDTR